MLGLRKFNTVQIDLWQGDVEKFDCDLVLQEDSILLDSRAFGGAHGLNVRHVSVFCVEVAKAQLIIDAVKKFLIAKKEIAANPRRITLVAPNLTIYAALQEALFANFEDS